MVGMTHTGAAAPRGPGDRLAAIPASITRTLDRGVLQPPPVSFQLLGGLEVLVGRCSLPIPGGKLRTLLAVLLLRANETVPLRELSDALWGDVAPANPRSTIQKYVMRMRRLLEPTGSVNHTAVEGYRLEILPDHVDMQRLDELVERGRRAAEAGEWGVTSSLLAEAAGLWRAVPPLGDVQSETSFH
jgi:DNA-binding SARP family transcriptional activator